MIFLSFSHISTLHSFICSVVIRALIVVAWSLPPTVSLLCILTLLVFVIFALLLPLFRAFVPVRSLLQQTIFVHRLIEVVAHLSVTANPSQAVHVSLKWVLRVACDLRSANKFTHNRNQTEGIECGVVLLRQSQRSSLPVWHLFAFTNFQWKYFFRHLRQTSLLPRNANLTIVSLCVDKVAHILVEVHLGQMLREDIHIAFERKPDEDGLLLSE